MAFDWEALKKTLGLTEALSEENATGLIGTAFEAAKKTISGLTEKIAALEAKAAELAGKIVPPPEPVHPEVVRLSRENRLMRLNKLVETAKITPVVRDKLDAALIGKDGQALALSLRAGNASQLDAVLEALAENDPIKLREQTGPQVLALSQMTGKTEPLPTSLAAAMRRAAGVPETAQ